MKFLIGNKVFRPKHHVDHQIDLENHAVSLEEGKQFAEKRGLMFAECSSKDDIGIDSIFEEVINAVLDHPTLSKETLVGGEKLSEKVVNLDTTPQSTDAGNCYC